MKVVIVYKNDLRARRLAGELNDNLLARGIETSLLDSVRLAETTTGPRQTWFLSSGETAPCCMPPGFLPAWERQSSG